jgi:hypothetical protein
MITTQLTKLTASAGMVLTNGKDFTHSVLLREDESPEDWSEITEEYYRKLQANMTPREFLLALLNKGKTREQIETIINSDDRVWAELTGATVIIRANPLLDQLCSRLGLTSADLDEMFGLV